jgi:tripeptidyl-peptidase-1
MIEAAVIFSSFADEIHPNGSEIATQYVYSYGYDYYSSQDLQLFQTLFSLPLTSVTDVGAHDDLAVCEAALNNCTEANLDLQYIMAVGNNVDTTFYYQGNNSDFLTSFINNVVISSTFPDVILITYGTDESSVSPASAAAFGNWAMVLSALGGVTIVSASGDDGVGGPNVQKGTNFCSYRPRWPASCPYVLTVGATQGPESNRPEIGCSSNTNGLITSGGGFSNLYGMHSYQKSAVATYFDTVASSGQVPAAGFNTTGRAYPDLALMGFNYETIVGPYCC